MSRITNGIIGVFAAVLSVGVTLFLVLPGWVQTYQDNLTEWVGTAVKTNGGKATQDLFDRAVANRAIYWDPALGTVEFDPPRADETHLYAELFLLKEAGNVLSEELRAARSVAGFLSVRTREPRCLEDCAKNIHWSIEISDPNALNTQPVTAQSIAQAAAFVQSSNIPAPLPRTNAALRLDSGPGYGHWKSWATTRVVKLRADVGSVDQIDIIGAIVTVPDGWSARLFCRDEEGTLKTSPCGLARANSQLPLRAHDAARLMRLSTTTNPRIVIDVQGQRLLKRDPPIGEYFLTDRMILRCDLSPLTNEKSCIPAWRAIGGRVAFAKRAGASGPDAEPKVPDHVLSFVGDWAEETPEGRLAPSRLAYDTNATAIVGGVPALGGTVLAQVGNIPNRADIAFSLDPELQRIVSEELRRFVQERGISSFPNDEPRASVVLLDLREPATLGAIRAAAGVPNAVDGLSTWDQAAGEHLGSFYQPSSSPAWTAAFWHHLPGSTWKVFTSIALIDAMTNGKLAPTAAANLGAMFQGNNVQYVEGFLGPHTLTGDGGICLPKDLTTPLIGTTGATCPSGSYRGKPVGDWYNRAPVDPSSTTLMGNREALAISSNMWFVAAMLYAESGRVVPNGEATPDYLILQTARRLGFLDDQELASGLGIGLTARTAIELDFVRTDDPFEFGQSVFGQSMKAGPLITAQLAASVAMGQVVKPSLVTPTVPSQPLFTSPAAAAYLESLRSGMYAAVNEDVVAPGLAAVQGTARGSFKHNSTGLAGRVAGKTGTAESAGDDRVSSFIGWLNAPDDRPAFAIGCSITMYKGGGSLCARLTARILNRVNIQVWP